MKTLTIPGYNLGENLVIMVISSYGFGVNFGDLKVFRGISNLGNLTFYIFNGLSGIVNYCG